MKVKHRKKGYVGIAVKLNENLRAPLEMIVQYDDGSASSEYIQDFMPLDSAFCQQDLYEYLWSKEP